MERVTHLTEPLAREIAAKLTELQGSRTDKEMGAVLGVSRVQWSHIRAGRRNLSYATMKRASASFPEILPIVMRDLTGAA